VDSVKAQVSSLKMMIADEERKMKKYQVSYNKICLFRSSGSALGVSVEWHLSLPLMNSFNKTKAAIFPMRAMLPLALSQINETETFLYSQKGLILSTCRDRDN